MGIGCGPNHPATRNKAIARAAGGEVEAEEWRVLQAYSNRRRRLETTADQLRIRIGSVDGVGE